MVDLLFHFILLVAEVLWHTVFVFVLRIDPVLAVDYDPHGAPPVVKPVSGQLEVMIFNNYRKLSIFGHHLNCLFLLFWRFAFTA